MFLLCPVELHLLLLFVQAETAVRTIHTMFGPEPKYAVNTIYEDIQQVGLLCYR